MKNKNLVIGIIVFLIIASFGAKNYLLIEKEQEKYRNSNTNENYEKTPNQYEIEEENRNLDYKNANNSSDEKNDFAGKKVFKYSSNFYDIEKPNGKVITKKEITYHTFDFDNKTVTLNATFNGKRINYTYPFYKQYSEKGILATTYVLKVETLGVKEIWWSPDVPNIGYDFDDGSRIACYDIKLISVSK